MPLVLGLVTLGGAVFLVLGWRSLVGTPRPNLVAGIRTPSARKWPENWHAPHRAAAPVLIWAGVAVLAAGLAFLPFAIAGTVGDGLVEGLSIGLGSLLLVGAVASWVYGKRAGRMGTS